MSDPSWALIARDFDAPAFGYLQVTGQMLVWIVSENGDGWIYATTPQGSGWIPEEIVVKKKNPAPGFDAPMRWVSEESSSSFIVDPLCLCDVVEDFHGMGDSQYGYVCVSKDTLVVMAAFDGTGWAWVYSSKGSGWVPRSSLREVLPLAPTIRPPAPPCVAQQVGPAPGVTTPAETPEKDLIIHLIDPATLALHALDDDASSKSQVLQAVDVIVAVNSAIRQTSDGSAMEALRKISRLLRENLVRHRLRAGVKHAEALEADLFEGKHEKHDEDLRSQVFLAFFKAGGQGPSNSQKIGRCRRARPERVVAARLERSASRTRTAAGR